MTIYRVKNPGSYHVEALGRDVNLSEADELDDQDPQDAEVITAWGPRGVLRAPNVEAATKAPGEQRTTRRKPV